MTKLIERNNETYKIKTTRSIFVDRNGKNDIQVSKAGSWGALHADGNKYHTCIRLAAEDGSILRNYESVPDDVMSFALDQVGTK